MPDHLDNADSPSPLRVVGLGEALFDCFETKQVLGGAPLNFATHCDALLRPVGGSAAPATRVGADELGDQVFETLNERGVSTAWVQRDPQRPTGKVQVTLDSDGVADYVFEPESAWDAIEFDASFQSLAAGCDAVAIGTLAQRSTTSRESILGFLAAAPNALRLFDVNLRQEYYSAKILKKSLELASAVKVNEEELEVLRDELALPISADRPPADLAERLAQEYALEWVAITRGARGAALWTADGWFEGEKPEPLVPLDEDADTVGAGDACCAGLMVGALLRWPVERTLALANATGRYVASRAGATPEMPAEIVGLVAEA